MNCKNKGKPDLATLDTSIKILKGLHADISSVEENKADVVQFLKALTEEEMLQLCFCVVRELYHRFNRKVPFFDFVKEAYEVSKQADHYSSTRDEAAVISKKIEKLVEQRNEIN